MVNDLSIVLTISTIFILVGVMLPFIEDTLEVETTTTADPGALDSELGANLESETPFSAFTILGSVLSMFVWTFGSLPFWLDAFFLILRATLVIFVLRTVRGTG